MARQARAVRCLCATKVCPFRKYHRISWHTASSYSNLGTDRLLLHRDIECSGQEASIYFILALSPWPPRALPFVHRLSRRMRSAASAASARREPASPAIIRAPALAAARV